MLTCYDQALLYYDYLLTIPAEIQCIWKRKLTLASILFLINRYATLVTRTLLIIQTVSWSHVTDDEADKVCTVLNLSSVTLANTSTVVGSAHAELHRVIDTSLGVPSCQGLLRR